MRSQLFASNGGASTGDLEAHTGAVDAIRNHGGSDAAASHRFAERDADFGDVAHHGHGRAGTDRRRRSADLEMMDTWRTDR
jgi:hypothetical protein